MLPQKKIFFLSDFHLGAPNAADSLVREKLLIRFLTEVELQAEAIFIVGDLFDFWYEYKTVVPKGYVRILGKLAQLTDAGVAIHFFVGNHDMWMNNYFSTELNIPVYFEPKIFSFHNKTFYIGHGDGLGPADKGYKILKKIFRHPISNTLFGWLPPTVGIGLANFCSRKSRASTGTHNEVFLGNDKEWLVQYCQQILQQHSYDYFIFGHRHLPLHIQLNEQSTYVNLGDWIKYFSYAEFDGEALQLKYYNPQ